MELRTSVAMTTYNGSRYVEQQMHSLLRQTRRINQVVICDDCSTDSTIFLVESFIRAHGLEHEWEVHLNQAPKGVTRNFLDCAKLTYGELVFFADQDDIWEDTKVERMARVFEKDASVSALSCAIRWADASGVPLRSIRNVLAGADGRLRKVSVAEQVRRCHSPGLALAFRRSILSDVDWLARRYNLPHDLPVGIISAVNGSYWILGERLVTHRVHGSNSSSPQVTIGGRLQDRDGFVRGRAGRLELMKAVLSEYGQVLCAVDRVNLEDAIRQTEATMEYILRSDCSALARQLLHGNPMLSKLIQLNALAVAVVGRMRGARNA